MLQNGTTREYNFWEFKGNVDYVDRWFLMATPLPILAIWVAYIAFVLKVGPALMKNRPPYKLNNLLLVYNGFQILVSCFILWTGSNVLLKQGFILRGKCLSENAELKKYITTASYYYLSAKVTELLDTVFFVLRKNYRQVSFLHVYHHSVTMLASWFTLKYEPSYSLIFLGTINSFVHVVMYAYYGLSTFPVLTKYLWWKKYITSMQLVQFLLIALQVMIDYKTSSCRSSYFLVGFVIFHLLLFMYLFSDFYIRSYIKNSHIHASKNITVENNNNVKYMSDKHPRNGKNTMNNIKKYSQKSKRE